MDTKGDDHCADVDRYLLMSLHETKTEIPKTELEKKLERMRKERAQELEPSLLNSFYTGEFYRRNM